MMKEIFSGDINSQYNPEKSIDVSSGIPAEEVDYEKIKSTLEDVENEFRIMEEEAEGEYLKGLSIIEDVKKKEFSSEEEYKEMLKWGSEDDYKRFIDYREGKTDVPFSHIKRENDKEENWLKFMLAKRIEEKLAFIKKRRDDKIATIKRDRCIVSDNDGGLYGGIGFERIENI